MSRSLLSVVLYLGIFLSACASARAENPYIENKPDQTSSAAKIPEAGVSPSMGSPSRTAVAAEPARLGSSVLVADGGGKIEPLLYPLDPGSGEALPGYEPLPLGMHYTHAFSPDGHTLAFVTFLSSKYSRPHSLVLLDLATWQEHEFNLKLDSYVRDIAFSPDGSRLAIHFGDVKSIVMLFDRQQEAATAEVTLDILATQMRFTEDGRSLMLYGTSLVNRFTTEERTDGAPTAILLDASDLSSRWTASLESVRDDIYPADEKVQAGADLHQPGAAVYYSPGIVFAPDRDALHVVHPDQDRLTTVDFAALKVETVEIRPRLTWFERLLTLGGGFAYAKIAEGKSKQAATSPDGQLLYVVGKEDDLYQDKNGDWQVSSTPLGLQVIHIDSGELLRHYETDASLLSISPDGSSLYLLGWDEHMPWTEVLDAVTLQPSTRLEGMQLRPGYRMNGEILLLSSEWVDGSGHHIAVAGPDSLNVLNEWRSSRYLAWLSTR